MSTVMLYVSAVIAHWLFTFGGIAMVGIGVWEKFKHKETAKWVFWGLATLLLLVAFYQAWLDEHHNTATVIEEKAKAVGGWGTCNGDLKTEKQKSDLLASHNLQQETTINNQQDSVNKCIVALGSTIKPEPLKTHDWYLGTVVEKRTPQYPYWGNWVLLTNKTVTPIRLLITCDGDIATAQGWILGTGGMMTGGWGGNLSSKKFGLGIITPAWTPTNSLLVTIYTAQRDVGTCTFQEQ